jgi:hypothetical protein
MGYYDSVKDSVKDNEKRGENSAKGGNFDTLKENAEKNTKPDEEKGDDTPIEVVEEGGIEQQEGSGGGKKQSSASNKNNDDDGSEGNPFTSDSSVDTSGLEEKLDKIIEQNERMIDILESFGS